MKRYCNPKKCYNKFSDFLEIVGSAEALSLICHHFGLQSTEDVLDESQTGKTLAQKLVNLLQGLLAAVLPLPLPHPTPPSTPPLPPYPYPYSYPYPYPTNPIYPYPFHLVYYPYQTLPLLLGKKQCHGSV